jgi:Electron transfer DM13
LKLIHSCGPITNKYESKDITLTLPGDLTVYDIKWLLMWCVIYSEEFGHIDIPKDLDVPPYRGEKIYVSLILYASIVLTLKNPHIFPPKESCEKTEYEIETSTFRDPITKKTGQKQVPTAAPNKDIENGATFLQLIIFYLFPQ